MAPLSQSRLKKILIARLHLADPTFQLEMIGGKICGAIVSSTFRGKSDFDRQSMMWDAVESEAGSATARRVGTLLAYTPEEWNIDLEGVQLRPQRRAKRAG